MKLKRFESALPEDSFNLVKKAAELSGMTVRSFVADAVLTRAVERTKEFAEADLLTTPLNLDKEALETLVTALRNPDPVYEKFYKALALAKKQQIPEAPLKPKEEFSARTKTKSRSSKT